MVGGFIYLHRQLRDHPYWEDPERLKAWIDILLMAAWKDTRRMVGVTQVDLKRGEFIASERFLAKRWKWSRGKVRRFIRAAHDMNELCTQTDTNTGTTYLVVKYEGYQTHRPSNGPATDQQQYQQQDQSKESIIKKNKKEYSADVEEVFEYWRAKRSRIPGIPRATKSEKRLGHINARLRDGFSVADLKLAVDGCLGNPHNVEGGYVDLELICRNDGKVLQYMQWARNLKGKKAGDRQGPTASDLEADSRAEIIRTAHEGMAL